MGQGNLKTFMACVALAGSALLLAPGSAQAVPSFARQTGMACEACHTVFPELTPFGRRFKLHAYSLDNLVQISGMNTSKDETLLLNQVPPLSFMLQASYTKTNKAVPDACAGSAASASCVSGTVPADARAQNGQVQFPQQASLFYAGRIAPNLGAFVQMTYDGAAGAVHWDNTDVRYARLANDNLLWGVSVNNNPTVQDLWNTTNAWQSPFDQRSATAPVPGAMTLLGGGAGGVAGASVYASWNDVVYAEFGEYRSAAAAAPLDSTSSNVVRGLAPYWRLTYERQWSRHSWEVGVNGMEAKAFPGAGAALTGLTNKRSDVSIDTQYQFIGDEHLFTLSGAYIKENQNWDASVAAGSASNSTNTLKTLRLGASYYFRRTFGGALGYSSTTGSADALLYAPATMVGYANSLPNTKSWSAEFDFVPYENTKFALQYTTYSKFNGGDANYDGSGRNAKDNNTLYLLSWINF